MAAPDFSAPPIPPNITAQQAPNPVMDFAQGGAGAAQNFDSMQFVIGRLNQVAELLSDVAKVVAVEKPAIMPILQKVAQGGALLMSEVQKSLPQGGAESPNQAPSQSQMTEAETPAGELSMAT